MKRKGKKPRAVPPDHLRCQAITAKGDRCKAKALEGETLCPLHGKAGEAGRAKGRSVVTETAREIARSLAEIDLRKPENQKKHLAHIIIKGFREDRPWAEIARFYSLLIQITQEVDTTATIIINRIIQPPE